MEAHTIWTIGHSTHDLEDFIEMLKAHKIEVLADVRHFPGSRRYPHFGKEALAAALKTAGLKYLHFPELGGRRKVNPDSHNTAWRHEAFRGYADYMETDEFRKGMKRLMKVAAGARTAIMCAEAVWWRCHRGMISDDLKIHGWEVLHIFDRKKTELHPFTPAARIVNEKLSYRELL